MEPNPESRQGAKPVANPSLWTVLILLIVTSVLHYLTPQLVTGSSPVNEFLSRHAVVRIVFILPIAIAASGFGRRWGIVVLSLAVAIMLPRAIWVSPSPADAFLEIAVVAVVGYLVIWLIEVQSREEALRQKAVARLGAVNALNKLVTASLDLDQILHAALAKVLEVTDMEAGLIFSVDQQMGELTLGAHRGLSDESVTELAQQKVGEGIYGVVAQSGERMIVDDASQITPMMYQEGLRTQISVPLSSEDEIQGVLAVAARGVRQFQPDEFELLMALGGEIGTAMNNASLYESMRFYARGITQIQEGERQRIARELHDETIQLLIAVSRRLDALATLPEPLSQEARQRLLSLRELVGSAVSGARRFVQDLRPPALDHLGLVPALEGLTHRLGEEAEIRAQLAITGGVRRLLPDQELALFRIAQEALNNVIRHAQASLATVRLDFGPHEVQMVVQDNGPGFNVPREPGERISASMLGLIGMQERAQTWGGVLTIESQMGQGTQVIVSMPAQPYSLGEEDEAPLQTSPASDPPMSA